MNLKEIKQVNNELYISVSSIDYYLQLSIFGDFLKMHPMPAYELFRAAPTNSSNKSKCAIKFIYDSPNDQP